jgi:hypothetical protein
LVSAFARHPGLLQVAFAAVPGAFGLFGRMIDGRASLTGALDSPAVRLLRSTRVRHTAPAAVPC